MEVFVGTICSFGFNFAPRGWATCQGQLIAIVSSTTLFSLLGTQFGGNGTSTFALPDLRGRNTIHQGNGPGLSSYSMGETGGQENVTVSGGNLPAHTHPVILAVSANARSASSNDPASNYPAPATSGGSSVNTFASSGGTFLAGNPAFSLSPAGSGIPLNIQSPYLVTNMCICLEGIYPARN